MLEKSLKEFGIILIGTPNTGAETTGERLRKTVEAREVTYGGQTIKVNISVGVTELTDDVESYKDWLDRTDKALYYSKEHGRNRTTLYSKDILH